MFMPADADPLFFMVNPEMYARLACSVSSITSPWCVPSIVVFVLFPPWIVIFSLSTNRFS